MKETRYIAGSSIFSIDNTGYLYVSQNFPQVGCNVRNINEADLPSYAALFASPEVMKFYASGRSLNNQKIVASDDLKEEQPTEAYKYVQGRYSIWHARFSNTQPHGGLTVLDNEGGFVGFAVAGGGDEPGASEVAGAGLIEQYGKRGIGSKVLDFIVREWAPEVKAIGDGIIVDNALPNLQKSFSCFGGKPLSRLDATYFPCNVASDKLSSKYDFHPAVLAAEASPVPFSLEDSGLSFAREEDHEDIKAKFFAGEGAEARKPNIRYKGFDENGVERTISFKERFNSFRYHIEHDVHAMSR